MRLIDADALIALVQDSTILGDGFKYAFVALVNGEPTVDAVEVVRCKDCKYYQKVYGGVPLGEVGHCICHSFETVPGWFCADGERKEQNDE